MYTQKPKIALLTSLTDYAPSYSLVGIILDQARALERHGYDYDLLCLKNFNQEERDQQSKRERLRIKYILPQTTLVDYRPEEPPHENFDDQVRVHLEGDPDKGTIGYLEALEQYDTVITHDLMFISWHLPQNAAIRKCIEKWPEKNWLHWIHSSPSVVERRCYPSELRLSAAPHSTYVFLNEAQKLDCALMLGTTKDRIATVYNPKDMREVYDFSRETCAMIEGYDLFDHEIMQVYPFSSPRWEHKGVKALLRIFGLWKEQGIRVKLVLVNANCNQEKDKKYQAGLEAYALRQGLELDRDVILTSRFADVADLPRWRYCVPQRTVRELGLMSNMFIFASPAECCSLIEAEASVAGKFMVLNRECSAIMEFGHLGCLSYEFTSNNPDNPNAAAYYECMAREILAEFRNDVSIQNATIARTRTYNRDWIFRNQFEPLLWKKFADRISVDKPKTLPKKNVELKILKDPLKEKVRHELDSGKIDYENPRPGDPCPIFEECSEERRDACYAQAGRCLVLGEE